MLCSQVCGFLAVLQFVVLVEIAVVWLSANGGGTAVNILTLRHVM